MGLFSKVCAKTQLPILHKDRGFPAFAAVVALTPDGSIVQGEYDGYARVGEVCLADKWDSVKMVLAKHYKGESYGELGPSGPELGQGHFMSDEFIIYCVAKGKFRNYAAYKAAFNKFAQW